MSLLAMSTFTQAQQSSAKPEDTEVWQPEPKVVTPAAECGKPPSDAIVLFDGKNLDEWVSAQDRSQPAKWNVGDGIATVAKSTGNIETKRLFHNYQFHMEWRT
ncbi:MAG TPA: family 16 glycoside hydrolase, partial [Candidatus Sulfotelmatobacter sp.]|nr:family 16 glycoside hydrolase [Candidatus Sulfotelmatobacter sp.]